LDPLVKEDGITNHSAQPSHMRFNVPLYLYKVGRLRRIRVRGVGVYSTHYCPGNKSPFLSFKTFKSPKHVVNVMRVEAHKNGFSFRNPTAKWRSITKQG